MPSSIDRLVRKEVSLGAIRELPVPEQRIGLQIAPFHSVDTDDVIFDYIKGGLQEGLAPARAEDAEAELGQKDDLIYGSGRAAIIDWAFKDKYTASDVTRYRDDLRLAQLLEGANTSLNFNSPARSVEQFNGMLSKFDKTSTITLLEITGLAKQLSAETYRPFEVFAAAGIIYIALNAVVACGFGLVERALRRH